MADAYDDGDRDDNGNESQHDTSPTHITNATTTTTTTTTSTDFYYKLPSKLTVYNIQNNQFTGIPFSSTPSIVLSQLTKLGEINMSNNNNNQQRQQQLVGDLAAEMQAKTFEPGRRIDFGEDTLAFTLEKTERNWGEK